jgi:hypothetical protein
MTWSYFFLIFIGVVSEKMYQLIKKWVLFLKDERSRPYKWSCVDCREQEGNRFDCSANDVTALDNMILAHKSASHSWRDV